MYINGVKGTPAAAPAGNLDPGTVGIGQFYVGGGYNFNGLIADVQLYNTSLDANQVAALYREGVGGAPITIQNLVGWWPLNGNANDYSGNNNNGQAGNVIYTGSWTNGYTAP